ncbi:hypothetical protein [Acinetobacter gerneri]|jgi:hypothetical protein|uniref:hypothetical protein n=1 Tax=Acinetobacter gerneri TaxID=202952 RepID=UPI0023F3D9B6|nr:hypothetical protein [Acinetobacter gerneri]MCH4243792.1 hypothetical protein [Acinetobacter gerneri]
MKKLLICAVLIISSTTSIPAFSGSCDYSWQSAKDGSSCGDRAADRRAGGR